MRITGRRTAVATALLLILSAGAVAQRSAAPATATAASPADTTSRIVAAAQAVLASLDAAGRAKVQFPFDGPQKTRWSNLPSPMFERQGLRLADLTPTQRDVVMALVRTALSADGYRKVTEIMHGDEVLRNGGGGNPAPGPGGVPGDGRAAARGRAAAGTGRGGPGGGPGGSPAFGEDQYYLAFVGTPSTTAPWMLQFGGHHLAINLTLDGARASMTPSLPAAQPASYTIEGREVRPLGKENDKAFALVNALDAAQRSEAILTYRVADLVLGPGRDGRTIEPEGVRASALPPAQQTMLLELVREWAGIMNDAFADPRMAELRVNLPQTYFAWSGPTTNGSAAYFRIQGPTLVIEYAPQGGTDHIHTIYRDPTNDYGAKFVSR
jgi:hypothetical protein